MSEGRTIHLLNSSSIYARVQSTLCGHSALALATTKNEAEATCRNCKRLARIRKGESDD